MLKTDCEANKFVADYLQENYEWIIRAIASCEENFGIDDVNFSAGTEENYFNVELENKTLMGGWQFKYDGDWNPYFTCGIYNKLVFKSTTPAVGTPIYFVNATDAYGDYDRGKYKRIMDAHACLSFLAPDGIILFNQKDLKDAFIGYADYYVKHTTAFHQKGKRLWETKAILDLSKGKYLPCNPPIELFEK